MSAASFGSLIIGIILIIYVKAWSDMVKKADNENPVVFGFFGFCALAVVFAKFVSLATI
jgi:hypothetical protein